MAETAMRYVSTRGGAPAIAFEEAMLTGLAPDGGLYVPEVLPRIDEATLVRWAGLGYAGLAAEVMQPFVAGFLEADELRAKRRAADAYVDQVLDRAQLAIVNGFHQRAHPGEKAHRFLNAFIPAQAAQGRMFGSAPFGGVDHFAREQAAAHFGKVARLGQCFERVQQRIGQMRLGPIEQD